MRPFKVVSLAAATALAAVLAGAPVAVAAPAHGGHGHGGGEKVFELTTRTTQDTHLDADKDGLPSPGDEDIFTEDVFRDGKKVGTDGGVCTILRTDNGGVAQCLVTLSLEEGQITTQGLVTNILADAPGEFDIAITGGTGAFSKARGHLHGSNVTEAGATLEVHLSR
ncbi:hypothetical protein GCM10010193_13890 [Kitasatospora atroaurantiaca]|uniref:Allene oxide cyclase barrel-like domain-containing protein n=1 Tax=Kitasatospora atroaurantiaca TaxID=285545 RepID=A0A561ESY6_9ACTN|nr:dirigent protein [Kitasatospora atroaurantiaca]TWE18723.1 hypothetical protein FB465_3811 [Kitasatospora atroaurantiaca]